MILRARRDAKFCIWQKTEASLGFRDPPSELVTVL